MTKKVMTEKKRAFIIKETVQKASARMGTGKEKIL